MASEILPDWIQWIAQDKNGAVWGFEAEPHLHEYGWYENEVGRYILLFETHKTTSWNSSLTARSNIPSSIFAELINT